MAGWLKLAHSAVAELVRIRELLEQLLAEQRGGP